MSKKHRGAPGPIPPGNRPRVGPGSAPDEAEAGGSGAEEGAPFQDQDLKRRLGDFVGKGEHSIQQPGRLNDGDIHSR